MLCFLNQVPTLSGFSAAMQGSTDGPIMHHRQPDQQAASNGQASTPFP